MLIHLYTTEAPARSDPGRTRIGHGLGSLFGRLFSRILAKTVAKTAGTALKSVAKKELNLDEEFCPLLYKKLLL